MKFRIDVADRQTGDESTLEYEGASAEEVREKANQAGYLVSEVHPAVADLPPAEVPSADTAPEATPTDESSLAEAPPPVSPPPVAPPPFITFEPLNVDESASSVPMAEAPIGADPVPDEAVLVLAPQPGPELIEPPAEPLLAYPAVAEPEPTEDISSAAEPAPFIANSPLSFPDLDPTPVVTPVERAPVEMPPAVVELPPTEVDAIQPPPVADAPADDLVTDVAANQAIATPAVSMPREEADTAVADTVPVLVADEVRSEVFAPPALVVAAPRAEAAPADDTGMDGFFFEEESAHAPVAAAPPVSAFAVDEPLMNSPAAYEAGPANPRLSQGPSAAALPSEIPLAPPTPPAANRPAIANVTANAARANVRPSPPSAAPRRIATRSPARLTDRPLPPVTGSPLHAFLAAVLFAAVLLGYAWLTGTFDRLLPGPAAKNVSPEKSPPHLPNPTRPANGEKTAPAPGGGAT